MEIPNPAAAPRAAAKAPGKLMGALKGHKPIVYVGVIVFAVIVAYYIHQREQAKATDLAAGDGSGDPVAPTDGTVGGDALTGYGSLGSPATYDGTVGTDGAFLGYGSAMGTAGGGLNIQDMATLIDSLTGGQGLAGVMPVNQNPITSSLVDAPTGGGPPNRVTPAVAHATPPPAPVAHVVENLPAAQKAAKAAHKVPYPNFPRRDTWGWYRVEYNPPGKKRGKYHHYRSGKWRKVG